LLLKQAQTKNRYYKTGYNLTNKIYEYTVKTLKVIDDKKHHLESDEIIKIRCGIRNSTYDPFNLYVKQNPKQDFLLVIYKGNLVEDLSFYYITKIQYYEKDGILYSTNAREDFEKYSGLTVDEFAEVLKQIK
jgi:hypothetical protein